MKILVSSYEFPPLGGGASPVVHGLASELVALGHEVDLVTMGFGGLPAFEVVDGIKVHRVPCIRRRVDVCHTHEMLTYVVSALSVALRLVRRRRYDVHHAHFLFPNGVLAWALRRLVGLPYVVTAHGSDVPGYNPDRFRRDHRVLAPLWSRVARGAEILVCPSTAIERLIHAREPDLPTAVVPNGIQPTRFSGTRARKERILVVTRMFPRKGVQHVLEAAAEADLGFELHVVGDGPYLPALRARAAELGAPVTFHGWLDNGSAELAELLETSRIFAFTSEAENFPSVLLEAMAAGLAIVTSAGTGCEEVVGKTGVLVPPGDVARIREAFTGLAAHPERCAALGRAARARLEARFTWEAVARKYVDVYRSAGHPGDAWSRLPGSVGPGVTLAAS